MKKDDSINQKTPSRVEDLRFPRWQRFARIAWATSVALLAGLAIWLWGDPDRWSRLVGGPESPVWIVTVVRQIGLQIAGELLLSLTLGFLTAASIAPTRPKASLFRFVLSFLLAGLIAFPIAFLLRTVANGSPIVLPTIVSIVWLCIGCLWGSWLGATWIGSRSSIVWGFRQLLTSMAIVILSAGTFLWMVLAPTPSVEVTERMTTEQRRELVERFKQIDPRELDPSETAQVTLSEQNVNQLANWGMSLVPGKHAAQIHLLAEKIAFEATLALPVSEFGERYINLTIAGRPLVRDGEIGFLPTRLKLGDWNVPAGLLSISGPFIVPAEWRNETTEPFFSSLRNVEVTENAISVTYQHFELKEGLVGEALVGLGVVNDLKEATAAHTENLIKLAQAKPQLSFSQCLEAAFRHAQERTEKRSAADENGAAIVALACLVGPEEFRALFGAHLPEAPPDVRAKFRQLTLRGRSDWAKHFLVSGALQVLSNSLASLDIGVLKEELDADGGSGFSFGDLMADRAGTMFAERVSESDAAAEEMQRLILTGIVERDFIPEGHDLPEGLSDRQFRKQYGSVDDPRYQRVLNEIDERIQNTRVHRK